MAQLFTADDIKNLVNSDSRALGFYLLEINDPIEGYQICACTDLEIAGHQTCVIFKKDLLALSRFYEREEVAQIVLMLSTTLDNIKRKLDSVYGVAGKIEKSDEKCQ